jgi:crotonobetainyl-CoA:carnitine CoA-transferase CaiB-like acyl-CoA transferase
MVPERNSETVKAGPARRPTLPGGSGPLGGVRVVDFSAVVSGPLAAMWLADQGADVVKVETMSGDVTRGSNLAPELRGMAGLFTNCNRGKRSIRVDVNHPAGREVLLDLCRSADVFVQNWRPGVVERLGVDFEAVSAVNPDIIYVSISGYGPDGPYASRRVYDPIIQGLTGHVAVQKNPEIPFLDLVRTIVCDKATALTAAGSVCAALFARERGAGGQHLVIPMLDAALAFFFPDGFQSKALLDDAEADARPTLARVYRLSDTADGQIVYFTATVDELHSLFRALGHQEWTTDPRYSDAAGVRANREEIGAMVAAAIASWPTSDLAVRLDAEQVPFGPVLDLDQVQDDPQIRHNQLLRTRHHPCVGRVLEAGHPVRFSSTPVGVARLAPQLGEHDAEILAEIGRSSDDVEALRSAGVIAAPAPPDNTSDVVESGSAAKDTQ